MDSGVKSFQSHSNKFLQDHLTGVEEKVNRRINELGSTLNLEIARVAALFHDVGKINPHFQEKLLKGKSAGYSSHAYLSAYAFWCFCQKNSEIVKKWLTRNEQCLSLLAIIALHHRNLPDFENGILKDTETSRLKEFLASNPRLPFAEFLQEFKSYKSFREFIEPHEEISLDISPDFQYRLFNIKLLEEHNKQPLVFFLETQFAFACLIEADKRDAGNNSDYKRERLLRDYFVANFAQRLEKKFNEFDSNENKSELDILRTQMREEAVKSLRNKLGDGERVFALAAPTGAGKTMMLLALAKEIFKRDSKLGVIYTLPFLSITEQVEAICREIFDDNVLRIDSRAENREIQKLQEKLDAQQTSENIKKLIQESFTELTFDHPFIITTFQQVFETLLSNRNAQLLRLPNFSKTIFLIDEIQALPYRLYSFFTALLDEFCRQFDSYAIISTATMPHLDFPSQEIEGRNLFERYRKPEHLLDARKYFAEKAFNRYRVKQIKRDDFKITDLRDEIIKNDDSCLIILNTIEDTVRLYELLTETYPKEECILLNTRFTLRDRRTKIWLCKRRLKSKQKIILISTQLVEAGVDIDFPKVFRDLCPLPNLIQSAGRCNRNGNLKDSVGKSKLGDVYYFALQKEDGKLSSELIYRNEARHFLNFCRRNLRPNFTESDLFNIQQNFFQTEVGEKLKFGEHIQSDCSDGERQGVLNLVKCIKKAAFETLGKFRLIDEKQFGYEFNYYVPARSADDEFEKLKKLTQVEKFETFEEAKQKRIKIENQIRKMSARMVTLRLRDEAAAPAFSDEVFNSETFAGIRKLANLSDYTFEKGIEISSSGGNII